MSDAALKRLHKEYRALLKSPPPHVLAHPSPENTLVWFFVLQGPPDTPYAGGVYLGRLVFPAQYPFKAPAIYMVTPNGRFTVNKRLCFSMSDYHPESWNPMWSVSSILSGLLSFMLERDFTVGSVSTSVETKQALARASLEFNLRSRTFRELFPDLVPAPAPAPAPSPAPVPAPSARGGNDDDGEWALLADVDDDDDDDANNNNRNDQGGRPKAGDPTLSLFWVVLALGVAVGSVYVQYERVAHM